MKKYPFLVALSILLVVGAIAIIYVQKFNPENGNIGTGLQNNNRSQTPANFNGIDLQATQYGIRWFPTHVHFGPDGDTLLVSLCHVKSSKLCRIGKYSIAKKHWDILPFDDNKTYLEPVFSPDGQWIVATMAGVKDAKPTAHDLRLVKMKPDGTAVQDLISAGVEPAMNEGIPKYQHVLAGSDIQATGATFSHNGKRLIYWRQFNLREQHAPSFPVLYLMDWETGKETVLVGRDPFLSFHHYRPFLTPDGERFVFTGSFSGHAVDPSEQEFVWKNSTFAASVNDAPITKGSLEKKLDPLNHRVAMDMDRQGRVLYVGSLGRKKKEGNPVALSIRPVNPDYKDRDTVPYPRLTEEEYRSGEGLRMFFNRYLNDSAYQKGEGSALFLRKPNADAKDEAVFDLNANINNDSASLSPDSQTLAFIWSGKSAGPDQGIGLLRQGEPMRNTRFLDWPKLDLIPSRPNSSKQP